MPLPYLARKVAQRDLFRDASGNFQTQGSIKSYLIRHLISSHLILSRPDWDSSSYNLEVKKSESTNRTVSDCSRCSSVFSLTPQLQFFPKLCLFVQFNLRSLSQKAFPLLAPPFWCLIHPIRLFLPPRNVWITNKPICLFLRFVSVCVNPCLSVWMREQTLTVFVTVCVCVSSDAGDVGHHSPFSVLFVHHSSICQL